jgi:broad specificity phosphatase PhoE
MPTRTIYLVRHGETEWNAASRMQGRLDSPLTESGRAQMAVVGELLARLGVDAIVASPLGRVRSSLAILNEQLALPVRFDDRLQEWSAGEWSGELYSEIGGKWPEAWAAWQSDRIGYASPGGENFLDLRTRARAFLDDGVVTSAHPRVAIVAHGFLNRALSTVLLGLPPAEMLGISQGNDTVIRILIEDGTPVADHFAGGVGPIEGLPLAKPTAAVVSA